MSNFQTFFGIMFFYAVLAYIICPAIGYYLGGRTVNAAGNGFVVGSLVTIGLWLTVGKNLANK